MKTRLWYGSQTTAVRGCLTSSLVFLLVGCSAASTARLNANCKKSPAVTGSGSGGSGRTSLVGNPQNNLMLASTLPGMDGDAGIGTGYLDIVTKSETGATESRRCTMQIRPIDQSTNEHVRIWTAGHCFHDPQTEKFVNSKFTAHIYFDGGYFSAATSFEGFPELARVSKTISQVAALPELSAIAEPLSVASSLPSETGRDCLEDEQNFLDTLSARKQVACFSRGEMRGLKAKLTLSPGSDGYLAEVLKVLRAREQKALSKLDDRSKSLLRLYEQSHHSERRRIADLRSVAYLMNKKLCDTFAANPNAPELQESGSSKPDNTSLCATLPLLGSLRELIIGQLNSPGMMPAQDLQLMASIYNDTTSSLADLRRRTYGCNFRDLDSFTGNIEQMTPCDMTLLSKKLWNRWIDTGTATVQSGPLNDAGLFGFNPDSYFVLTTNAAQTESQKVKGERGAARALALNSKTVLDFGVWLSGGKDLNTMLVNVDPATQKLFLAKGDSGSMLSIFGYFPAGLLSTVDGEKTAGGASITPLPSVGSEESSSSTAEGGC